MRKALAIFLLVVYLFGTSEAYQLLKLPAFVAHYFKHSRVEPSLTIAEFLKMHYAEAFKMDADWQQDMQLPFKTHEDNLGQTLLSYYPPSFVTAVMPPKSPIVQGFTGFKNQFMHGVYCPDIFQPPRA